MADAVTNFAAISTDAPNVWIAAQMYRLAERRLQLGQWATKYTLPQRFGKTLRIVRYNRLTLPTTTLTEGVPPDAVALAVSNVDVTVEQWGIVVLLTDVGLITTDHPALRIAIERSALAMAETLEREMAKMLLAGTNAYFGGTAGHVTRPTLASGDKISTGTILNATAFLRSGGAADFEGGLYGGVMSPQQEADVYGGDSTFQAASNYANVRALQYGEIGIWMGVRWVRGNFLPVFAGVAAPTTAAATATKAQITGQAAGPYNANATPKIIVVARDATNDYERKISQVNVTALGSGNSGVQIVTPTSANYVYDIYIDDTAAGGGTARLYQSRVAANTTITVGSGATLPAATAATPPSAPASGVEVFVAWVFGKDGFGRVELSGMSLQSYITPPGSSWSNPLAQGRKVGSKIMWKSFIIDNNYFARIETTSTYASTLPA